MDEIYSIGNSVFLYGVLQAVAAVAQTDEYGMLAKIGLMLGVILVMGRAAFSGGTQFPVGQLLGCLLLYTAFFGPSRQVAIVDVYSGSVRTVDHVPAGIALAGAQVSSIGYHITDLMEQAFATPRMTEQGYGAALETLKRVRLATSTSTACRWPPPPPPMPTCRAPGSSTSPTARSRALQNELRHKTGDEIWNKPLLTEGLRFESNLWGTKLDLTRPYTEPTCSEAHQQLVEYTNVVYLPYFKDVLAKKLRYASVAELEEKVELALAAMGLTANADTYLMTSALSSVYFAAIRQRAAEDFQPAYAAAVDDAVQQRNAQWLADESLFQAYVRPLLTFLEGFTYAMTPILVFLVGLGPYGMQVIIGFLVTLVWIVSWMPTLAVVNYFQHLIAAGRLEALAENGAGIDTMAGLFQADSIVQTYLATGGNMAAAAPALTASFLFLGARAFGANLMAQRLVRPGHVQGGEGEPGQPACRGHGQLPGPVHAHRHGRHDHHDRGRAGHPELQLEQQPEPGRVLGRQPQPGPQPQLCRERRAAGRRQLRQQRERGRGRGVQQPRGGEQVAQPCRRRGLVDVAQHRACRLGGGQRRAAHGHRLRRLGSGPARRSPKARGQPKYSRAAMSSSLNGTQAGGTSNAEIERIATQMTDQFRNDQAYQAQFGQALAYDVNQRHEDAVFSEPVGAGRSGPAAAGIGGARRPAGVPPDGGGQPGGRPAGQHQRARSRRHAPAQPEGRRFCRNEVFEHGLQGEARDNEWLTRELYPGDRGRPDTRCRCARLADQPIHQRHPARDDHRRARRSARAEPGAGSLGDAGQHAGIGPGMDSMGTIEGKVARKDELGADIQAGTTAKLNQIEQEVDAGQNHVAQRSAENNADVQHHQDINKVRCPAAARSHRRGGHGARERCESSICPTGSA